MGKFLYILENKYNSHNEICYKIGSTKNPLKRYNNFRTNSCDKLCYKKIFLCDCDGFKVEKMIKMKFNHARVKNGGGTEWYFADKLPIMVLKKFLEENNINFREINLKDLHKITEDDSDDEQDEDYIDNEQDEDYIDNLEDNYSIVSDLDEEDPETKIKDLNIKHNTNPTYKSNRYNLRKRKNINFSDNL